MHNPYLTRPFRIQAVTRQTTIDWTFRLESDLTPGFGQFLEVSLPGLGEAPISISDFGPGWLDLTIRNVGRVTGGIFTLRPGDTLHARGPYGHGFELDTYRNKNLLLVTGGTGLAPVKSLIRHAIAHRHEVAGFALILGFKSPADVLFGEEIAAWGDNANVILTVDRGDDTWRGQTGLVTHHIEQFAFQPGPTEAIVVGPPLMMKFSTLALLQRGLPETAITVSFERKMSCGLGKCGHCKIDETYVCLEGPVFNYVKARQLLD